MRPTGLVSAALLFLVAGTVLAIAIPAFLRNLSASKFSEATDGLDRIVTGALAYAEEKPHEISFPPSAPLTPAQVPRGKPAADPQDAWKHLTWLSLHFGFTTPHSFAFRFESAMNLETVTMGFVATAHGDLDADGTLSTFEVRGERRPGEAARVLPGLYVEREVE